VLDHLFSHLSNPTQVKVLLAAYDSVRRPRSQAVVDMARKFGRVYAFAESDLHEKPDKARAFFKEATTYTNNADLTQQNDKAMETFRSAIQSSNALSNGTIPSKLDS
jgi:salicylate hydroxylase